MMLTRAPFYIAPTKNITDAMRYQLGEMGCEVLCGCVTEDSEGKRTHWSRIKVAGGYNLSAELLEKVGKLNINGLASQLEF